MTVNVACPSCEQRFSSSYQPFAVYKSCNHFIHHTTKCVKLTCPLCDNGKVDEVIPIEKLSRNSQKSYDAISIARNMTKFGMFDYLRATYRVLRSIPLFGALIIRMLLDYYKVPAFFSGSKDKRWVDYRSLFTFVINLRNLFNINVTFSPESKRKFLDNSQQRVLVANHTNYYDLFALAALLNPEEDITIGFVASHVINTMIFGRAITRLIPHVMVQNDVSGEISKRDLSRYGLETSGGNGNGNGGGSFNNFERVKNFFISNPQCSKLLIFPEGMLIHQDYIAKFRSTAFKLGYPIQPIVIQYHSPANVFEILNFDFYCQDKVDVEVKVLDIISLEDIPTISGTEQEVQNEQLEQQMEKIRSLMAAEGHMKLSRVENRSVKSIKAMIQAQKQ